MPLTSGLQGGGAVRGGGGGGVSTILLIIQAFNQTAGALSQVKKDVEGLDKATKGAGSSAATASQGAASFTDKLKAVGKIALGAAVAIYGTAKAFEAFLSAGEQGAAFLQTTESFNQMMNSMGTSVTILQQLREASQGTVSDMQLMSYATTAMAGSTGEFGTAVAESLPRILEIAKAANKANPALGSVDYQFQSLIIGLKRLSPRLIDNTGLQIKLGAAYEVAAKQLGKSREELTAEEQQMALLNATLEAGDRLMNQVGGTAESMTDPFGRLRAETQNLSNNLKAGLVPASTLAAGGLAGLLHAINAVLSSTRNLSIVFRAQQKEIVASSDSYEDYVNAITEAALSVEGLNDYQKEAIELERKRALGIQITTKAQQAAGPASYKAIYDAAEAVNYMTRGMFEQIPVTNQFVLEWEQAANAGYDFADAEIVAAENAKRLKAETDNFNNSLEKLHSLMDGPVGKAIDGFREKVDQAKQSIKEAQEGLFPLNEKLMETFSPQQTAALAGIAAEFVNIQSQIAFLEEGLGKGGFIQEGKADEAKKLLDELGIKTEGLREQFALTSGQDVITDKQITDYDKLMGKTKEVEEAIRKETEALREQLLQITFNMAQAQLLAAVNLGTMGGGEAALIMAGLAHQLGLTDDATFALQRSIYDQTAAFLAGKITVDEWRIALGLTTEEAMTAAKAARDVADALKGIPTSIDVKINIHEVYTKVGGGHTYPIDPGRQHGGQVFKGMPYVVGEVGPELFIPPFTGTIIPNKEAEGYAGGNGRPPITINFYDTVVKSDIDLEILAYKVADRISRRRH